MNFFDVEGIRVKFMLEDKLLQVIEGFFMRSLQKEESYSSKSLVSEVSLWIVNTRITTIRNVT